jgi:hypothetical protein
MTVAMIAEWGNVYSKLEAVSMSGLVPQYHVLLIPLLRGQDVLS